MVTISSGVVDQYKKSSKSKYLQKRRYHLMVTMSENFMEMLETKSDTQSIDSSNSKMNKIFQNDDIQKAIDQVN